MKTAVLLVTVLLCLFGLLLAKNSVSVGHRDAASKPLSLNGYGSVTTSCQVDFDLDGVRETAVITSGTEIDGHPLDGRVVIMRQSKRGCRILQQKPDLNPWKLQTADVDGDGRQEIILGVWKKSPKDPVMAKRVFIYNWDGKQMLPKWLGSRLSRRFLDFHFKDVDKDGWDELLALEVSPGKPKRIGIYKWRSFGFEWLGCAEPGRWEELTK